MQIQANPNATIVAAVLEHLPHDPPGITYAHTDGPPFRLVIQKTHANYEETRPLTPFLPTATQLCAYVRTERAGLERLVQTFIAEGFDHGSGERQPGPPLERQDTLRNTEHFSAAFKSMALRTIEQRVRARVDFAVDLRPLDVLNSSETFTSELLCREDEDDAFTLTAGPVRLHMTLDQTGEMLLQLLELWAGEDRAAVLMTIAERLPYENTYDNGDYTRCVQALWLAMNSVRDTWPARTDGHDDAGWGVDPPPGLAGHGRKDRDPDRLSLTALARLLEPGPKGRRGRPRPDPTEPR